MKRDTALGKLVVLNLLIFIHCSNASLSNEFTALSDCAILNGYVFHTTTVRTAIQCATKCSQLTECTSVNMVKIPRSHGLFSCELNNRIAVHSCSHLTTKLSAMHFVKILYPTCKALKESRPATVNGVYHIKPVETERAVRVFCEMDVAGGGWTLVYAYRFVDLSLGAGPARLSVQPTWNTQGASPKSTEVPLGETQEGAMEFNMWKNIGEEFLTTSTVTNWYQCAPSTSSGTPGSLTGWQNGDLDCSVAKVQIPGTGCDVRAPVYIDVTTREPSLVRVSQSGEFFIYYEVYSDKNYPTHDPCGTNRFGDEATRSNDPRGAIYVR